MRMRKINNFLAIARLSFVLLFSVAFFDKLVVLVLGVIAEKSLIPGGVWINYLFIIGIKPIGIALTSRASLRPDNLDGGGCFL